MPFSEASGGGRAMLTEGKQGAILDNGTVTLQMGPIIRGEVWEITRTIVSCTSALDTDLLVYRDAVSDINLIEATYSGNQDVSDSQIEVVSPSSLFFKWTNGTPGAIAMVRLEGFKSFRRMR